MSRGDFSPRALTLPGRIIYLMPFTNVYDLQPAIRAAVQTRRHFHLRGYSIFNS